MDNVNHALVIADAEFMLVFVLGALAVGCVAQWLRVWRHESQGRVFFTLLTGGSVLLVLGLLGAALHTMSVF